MTVSTILMTQSVELLINRQSHKTAQTLHLIIFMFRLIQMYFCLITGNKFINQNIFFFKEKKIKPNSLCITIKALDGSEFVLPKFLFLGL